MSLTNEVNLELYRQMAELQEKLRRSEEERMKLEEKFRLLMKSCREEEEIRLKNLEERYAKFLEDCSKRNDRNDRILRSLQKVESGANILFAKSERLKLLKTHYGAYLERVMPHWKQPSSITYNSTYTSSVQPSATSNSFRSSYTSRLTSSSSDWRSGGTETTDNDRFLSFMRDRRPFMRGKSLTSSYGDTLKTTAAPSYTAPASSYTAPASSYTAQTSSYTAPTSSYTLDRKPEVHVEVTKPIEDIVYKRDEIVVKEPVIPAPVVQIIPEIEKIVIEDFGKDITRKTEPEPLVEKYKENQEIECLSEKDETERHKRDVEYVLSDEDVQPVEFEHERTRNLDSPLSSPLKRDINVGKLAPDITQKFETPVTYPKSPLRIPQTSFHDESDEVSPVTKKSLLEHQKSIDKLKAALSIEEDNENDKKENELQSFPQQVPPEEETDVTESSSEVWHQQQQPEEWTQEQNVIPSDVEEIENQFAEIVNPQVEEQPAFYEGQENPTEIDYNEEQYPESYYEQPQTNYNVNTNLASNVILEEDEYEEQQEYNQQQKPEFDQNYQYQGNEQQFQEQYQPTEQYQENEQYQQQYQESEQQYQQPYQENEQYQQPYQETEQYQQQYQDNEQYQQQYQDNEQYQQQQQQYQDNFYDENQQPAYNYDENNQQYDQNYDYQQQQNGDQQNGGNAPQENYQNYEENQGNYQEQQQYDPNYVQEGEYYQKEGENVEYQQEIYPQQTDQENYQEEQTPKQSNLAHLLESDSESYQIEHGGVTGNNEDSDFDFSLSQKQ